AAGHTVITITQPGTYEVSGKISSGQIAVDLGEDSKEDSEAVVNLILNNAEINCSVASSIVVFNAYECGSDKEEDASPDVNTENAGFNLILAKDSENVINGSYVAKIYKDGTTKEDIENDEAKKKYKFDAAIDSLISFNIESEENGKLIVNAENEGISSALHMTINGGEITINSSDDAINTSEDNISVLTINGGTIICDSGFGDEGDGIDSNGYIVINDGYVIACANGKSQDSGVDSDKGIYINGGTVLASGNMYDEVSSDSKQLFSVFNFAQTVQENELIMITDEKEQPITAFSAVNTYSTVVYSQPELSEGTYHLYKVSSVTGDLNGSIYTNISDYQNEMQLEGGSGFMMGGPGMGGGRAQMPDGEKPEKPDGDVPAMADGKRPEMNKEGKLHGEKGIENGEMEVSKDFVLSKDSYQFSGISEVK
ncbi:MAG: carbohydrate-binding domain-containing protein, partial [Lachnospiraceae bacterium]|nr:carbohydrate-binding domain-containing protein [Lachnospiraceae bacterium]